MTEISFGRIGIVVVLIMSLISAVIDMNNGKFVVTLEVCRSFLA